MPRIVKQKRLAIVQGLPDAPCSARHFWSFLQVWAPTSRTRSKMDSSMPKMAKEKGRPGWAGTIQSGKKVLKVWKDTEIVAAGLVSTSRHLHVSHSLWVSKLVSLCSFYIESSARSVPWLPWASPPSLPQLLHHLDDCQGRRSRPQEM